MVKITVSESNSKNLNVAYIYNSMTRYLSICGADADITFDDSRTNLVMTAENRFHSYLRKFTEERVLNPSPSAISTRCFRRISDLRVYPKRTGKYFFARS